MSDTVDVTRAEAWLIAARPHTLFAAASPVVVGTGFAFHEGVFAPLPALAALVGAGLIQIATNFANDYYDAQKGADTDDREGFTRVTQAGLIDPGTVKLATYATFLAAMVVGLYLVYVGGLPILAVGLLSIASGLAYTAGPYPLGYHGLGDLFVFVFFGVVAVTGTFYVQAAATLAAPLAMTPPPGTLPLDVLVASLAPAALTTAIIVVNNLRDLETDRAAGKHTLAVRLGYRGSRLEYLGLLTLAYLVPLWFVATGDDLVVLLPVLSLPLAVAVYRTVAAHDDAAHLDPALTRTGQLLALFAILFAVGLAV